MSYTFKQYKECYQELLERHKLEYEDHNEFTFIESELESYYESLIDIDGIEEIPFQFQFLKSFTNEQLSEALKSQKEFKDFAIKSNLSSSMIIDFLEHRKAELRSAPALVVGSESKEVNASNKKADYTKMPWFIVGLADADGSLETVYSQFSSSRNVARELGVNNHNYILKLYHRQDIEKTKLIYDHCVSNCIEMTNEFQILVSNFQKLNRNKDW